MAASASASFTAAPSNTSSSGNFQVFLNHRGVDVKKTFASHLYRNLRSHGFRVFLDKPEMKVGEGVDPQIRGAIATASIHIAIFSLRYAQSKWCLEELELMLDSMDKRNTTIIPVFYDVSPSELRRTSDKTKGYGKDLCDLVERYEPKIPTWKKALSRVSNISGFKLTECDNGDQGELVDRVVQRVKEIIIRESPPLYVAAYPTGLNKKLEDFQKTVLLQQQQHSESTKVFGIVGPCGVGKTTLAREFLNRNRLRYERTCVLDVRVHTLRVYDNKLLQDFTSLTPNIDGIPDCIEMLSSYLSDYLVLIILDNVDNDKQLDALFSQVKNVLRYDSIILVTSCNKKALESSGIEPAHIYKLECLDEEHSRQLFCQHAFHQLYPEEGFEEVVNQFLNISDGLPLSLRELGARLYKKQFMHWEAELRKILNAVLPAEIQRRLKIGYDGLDDQEKEVFLDTACFFTKEDKDMATRIWDASNWEGSLNLHNLENKFLLEIDSSTNCIIMHDHNRDLGRNLADQELPKFHRRIWNPTTNLSYNALHQPIVRGINRVEGKSDQLIDSHHGVDMSQLRLLKAEGDCLESISNLVEQSDLLWLCWDNCPYTSTSLRSWIPTRNLKGLKVNGHKQESWHGQSEPRLTLDQLEKDLSVPLSARALETPNNNGLRYPILSVLGKPSIFFKRIKKSSRSFRV